MNEYETQTDCQVSLSINSIYQSSDSFVVYLINNQHKKKLNEKIMTIARSFDPSIKLFDLVYYENDPILEQVMTDGDVKKIIKQIVTENVKQDDADRAKYAGKILNDYVMDID